jgi:hypothetical protein
MAEGIEVNMLFMRLVVAWLVKTSRDISVKAGFGSFGKLFMSASGNKGGPLYSPVYQYGMGLMAVVLFKPALEFLGRQIIDNAFDADPPKGF